MNRNIAFGIIAALLVVAGIYLMMSHRKDDSAIKPVTAIPPMVSASLNELPNLSVKLGDQSSIILRELKGDIILIFFNPECDHCQQEAEQIAANGEVFRNWQVYFITDLDAKTAEEFGVKYRLTNENYHFGSASAADVYNAVGALTQVPTILVYKNRMFLEKFEGITPIEELKKVL